MGLKSKTTCDTGKAGSASDANGDDGAGDPTDEESVCISTGGSKSRDEDDIPDKAGFDEACRENLALFDDCISSSSSPEDEESSLSYAVNELI
jgi:hypothetical protein